MTKTLLAAGVITALTASAGSASAHAHLLRSTPAAGETVAHAPREIRTTFGEPLVARFSALS